MIRLSWSSVLPCVLAALLAVVPGCATAVGEPTESETSLDDLLSDDTNADSPAAEEVEEEEPSGTPGIRSDERTAPNRDSRTWAQGEPKPIPWHENSAPTNTGGMDNPDDNDPTSPTATPPGAPQQGR